MLLTIVLNSTSQSRFLATDQDKEQVLAVTKQTDSLLLALVDMETGVRGYVITGDREFLEPYTSGQATYPVSLSRLKALLDGRTDELDRVARVGNLIVHWQQDVLQPEIDDTGERLPVAADVASKAGKLTLDEIRTELSAINTAEAEHLAQLTAQADSLRRTATYGGWGFAMGAVLLGLWLANALARSLTRPIDALLAATERMAAGHVGEQVEVRWHDEIGQLAASFNRMSRELQAHQEENAAQHEELQAQQEELIAQNDTLMLQREQVTTAMSQLERERDRLVHLNRFHRGALDCRDLKALSTFMLAQLSAAGGAQVGALARLEPLGAMRIEAAMGLTEGALAAASAAGFPAEAAATGQPLLVSYPQSALLRPVYHTELPVEHELYLPIEYGSETLAVVILGRTGPEPFSPNDIRWLEVLAGQAAAALSNRIAYEKLTETFRNLQESAAHVEELSAQVEEERDRATSQRDNLRAILESTSEGICMFDSRGQVMLVNDRFWELAGLAPQPDATAAELSGQMLPTSAMPSRSPPFSLPPLRRRTSPAPSSWS
jgi:CHASE3 domain sensor protein